MADTSGDGCGGNWVEIEAALADRNGDCGLPGVWVAVAAASLWRRDDAYSHGRYAYGNLYDGGDGDFGNGY
jgi:hypothetical protein